MNDAERQLIRNLVNAVINLSYRVSTSVGVDDIVEDLQHIRDQVFEVGRP